MDNVLINIKTAQYNTSKEEIDTIELSTEGSFYQKNGYYYLIYQETELSGLEGTTTKIKFKDDIVELKRIGSHSSSMIFEKDRRFQSTIITPMGNLNMEIMTNQVSSSIKSSPLEIQIKCEYLISIKGLFDGKNTIEIKVYEK